MLDLHENNWYLQLEEYSKDYLCVSLCHGFYLLRHGAFLDTAWNLNHSLFKFFCSPRLLVHMDKNLPAVFSTYQTDFCGQAWYLSFLTVSRWSEAQLWQGKEDRGSWSDYSCSGCKYDCQHLMILSWCDWRATALFLLICLIAGIVSFGPLFYDIVC